MMKKIISIKLSVSLLSMVILFSCSSVKPNLETQMTSNSGASGKGNKEKKQKSGSGYVLTIKAPVKPSDDLKNYSENQEKEVINNVVEVKPNEVLEPNKGDSYSNSIRVKTVYELAMDANPPMFLPHDEFETASEYKQRVTEQVKLMKEIVQMTSQKMEIKNAQRSQVAKEKELSNTKMIESLMAESSSSVEFTPTDIGRYNPENETFPVILHDTQYQISVPREEARTFKANFKSVKIKGIKQLRPKYDVSINVSKAHIRSRPNGSIVGIASRGEQFEHVQDEDEWFKLNYKGQFGFTHVNNAELKLVDIANEYEYHDMVAIHPTTGSMFAMISVDKLVKAPLNLASRKLHESGQPDGPKDQ